MHLLEVKKIYDVFDTYNISPVLIKGLSSAINYPNPYQRSFSDIDLAVPPELFKKSEEIIKENRFNIDLHKGLRHLDILEWGNLYQNSRLIKIGDAEIRVLRPEDNLRVLCVHWLTDGGADRSRLWDIYFAILSSMESFDWDRFFNVVGDKRRTWLIVVLSLVKEYLGLEFEESVNRRYLSKAPDWIRKEIEKEWKSDNRLIPLKKVFLRDHKIFYQQILKRFPPNRIQSVIETDGLMTEDKFYLTNILGFTVRAKKSARDILKIIRGN